MQYLELPITERLHAAPSGCRDSDGMIIGSAPGAHDSIRDTAAC